MRRFRGVSDSDDPPLEPYGRITNPQRFAVLHDVADRVQEALLERFDVDRDGRPNLPEALQDLAVRAVRLTPKGGGAPIIFAWTRFPGVVVAFGKGPAELFYPACGCDACPEDPAELVRELERAVMSVVGGHFVEYTNRKGETGWRIDYQNASGLLAGYRARTPRGRLRERRWPPWKPR